MSSEVAVETRNLTKKYNGLVAVDNLNLSISKGEIYGLLGPNGAGKTTAILMLLGLTEPTSGQCSVYGFNPVREPLKVKSIIGYLPEKIGFYEDLTAKQNLKFTANLNNIERREAQERINEALQKVGLEDHADVKVGKFSRGMKQRLGIANVLIKKPRIAFLDEPTQGLDPKWINETLRIFSDLSRREGMTILLSSHLLHQVQQICQRMGIMLNGKLVVQGTINELRRIRGQSWIVEAEVGEIKPDLLKQIKGMEDVKEVKSSRNNILVEGKRDLRPEISKLIIENNVPLLGLRAREVSLDEIYMKYFKEA